MFLNTLFMFIDTPFPSIFFYSFPRDHSHVILNSAGGATNIEQTHLFHLLPGAVISNTEKVIEILN